MAAATGKAARLALCLELPPCSPRLYSWLGVRPMEKVSPPSGLREPRPLHLIEETGTCRGGMEEPAPYSGGMEEARPCSDGMEDAAPQPSIADLLLPSSPACSTTPTHLHTRPPSFLPQRPAPLPERPASHMFLYTLSVVQMDNFQLLLEALSAAVRRATHGVPGMCPRSFYQLWLHAVI